LALGTTGALSVFAPIRLLRPGAEDGRHDQDLSVGRASGATVRHLSRLTAASHSPGPSNGIS
jgi:hypothetical protein